MELRRLWRNGNSVVCVLPPTVLKHCGVDIGDWIRFTLEEGHRVSLEKVGPADVPAEEDTATIVL